MDKRVIVVDDVADWRRLLGGLLTDEGYLVEVAGTTDEALLLLHAIQFDVAILDIRLDETDETNIDGLHLAHKVKTAYPDTAIIVLTGYATMETVRRALEPNVDGARLASDFVEKDNIENLLAAIHRILAPNRESKKDRSFAVK